ncbi:uncharacterized protein METZ01_LOCUS138179, partial [marine metagenome]
MSWTAQKKAAAIRPPRLFLTNDDL